MLLSETQKLKVVTFHPPVLPLAAQKQPINMRLKQSQVSPQQVSMSLLPGEEKEVDVEVFAPTKGPLDLYILMDFSNSMVDDLNNLKRMGTQLGERLCIGNLSCRLSSELLLFNADAECISCSFFGEGSVGRLHHRVWKVRGQSGRAPDRHETLQVSGKMSHLGKKISPLHTMD